MQKAKSLLCNSGTGKLSKECIFLLPSSHLNNSKVIQLKNAAEIALSEIEKDIAKIKEFLDTYVPPNN